MTRVTLALAVAVLAGCASMTPEQRDRREYRNADWTNRFVDFRVRCHAAGGRVLILASSRTGTDGIPGRGDYYSCDRN